MIRMPALLQSDIRQVPDVVRRPAMRVCVQNKLARIEHLTNIRANVRHSDAASHRSKLTETQTRHIAQSTANQAL